VLGRSEQPAFKLALNHASGASVISSGEFAGPEDLALDALSGSRGLTPFTLAQLAPVYNRPDRVLENMGYGNEEHLEALRAQWRRRLELLGLDEETLERRGELEPPRVVLSEASREGGKAEVVVRAADRVGLASYQLRVNGVPLLDGGGRRISGRRHQARHTIELTDGDNLVELSALSTRGVESQRVSVALEHTDETRPMLYFVGLGVSEYDDPVVQDLAFAHKDVEDVGALLETVHEESGYEGFEALVPTHEQLTGKVLARVRAFIGRARPRDTVIVMVSGHGTYSREAAPRYFFVARDTDPDDLVHTGIALEQLEEVIASTPARKRAMWMDTCASGDLSDARIRQLASGGSGDATRRGMKPRSFAVSQVASQSAANRPTAREWVYQRGFIHRDLANRTGATVLSSSRGFELSWESKRWGNGAFTEALLEGLAGAADGDDEGSVVSLDELARFVERRTAELTGDRQHPAVDRENPYLRLGFSAPR
jgi:hypothetical protein